MFESALAWLTATFAAILTAIVPGYGDDPTPVYNGYVEADYVYVAPSVTGRIRMLPVAEGDEITVSEFLFDMDASQQRASLRAANARVAQAEANLRNLETGSREAEIAVIRAFLPKQMPEEEIRKVCAKTVAETGASGLRDMGKCMAALKEQFPGQMDFGKASGIVKTLLR